jgi:hypothetical protein
METKKSRVLPVVTIVFWIVMAAAAWFLLSFMAAGSVFTLLLNDVKMGLAQIAPKAAWHLSRSTAVVAYLLLTGSVAWGLVVSTRIAKDLTPAPLSLAMHNIISWLALSLAGIHALLLLFDNYFTYTLSDLLLPFTGPYRPFWVGLGIIGLYVVGLASVSFSWRSWLGQKGWRFIHHLTFPAYALVTLHGLMAGTDGTEAGMRVMFTGSALLVLFLTNYRLIAAQRQRRAQPSQ